MSRWENAPILRKLVRLTYAMVDLYYTSYARLPKAMTLDIDDTVNVVHGHQAIKTGSGPVAARTPASKWVNTALGNIKTAITGTHRAIGAKHVSSYLAGTDGSASTLHISPDRGVSRGSRMLVLRR